MEDVFLCSDLHEGCSSCSSFGDCKSCGKEYYLNKGECQKCSEGCSSCDFSGSCSACLDGYYLEGTECQKCSYKFLNCATCTSDKCTGCVSGKIDNGVCSGSCSGNCKSCDSDGNCFECNDYYYI